MRRSNYRRGAGLERRRTRGSAAAVQLSITRAQTVANSAGGPNRARPAAVRAESAPTESADRSARAAASPARQRDLRLRRVSAALARRRYRATVHARRYPGTHALERRYTAAK